MVCSGRKADAPLWPMTTLAGKGVACVSALPPPQALNKRHTVSKAPPGAEKNLSIVIKYKSVDAQIIVNERDRGMTRPQPGISSTSTAHRVSRHTKPKSTPASAHIRCWFAAYMLGKAHGLCALARGAVGFFYAPAAPDYAALIEPTRAGVRCTLPDLYVKKRTCSAKHVLLCGLQC